MARRKSFQQLLIAFAMNATDDELNAALDTLKAFKDTRTPKPRAKRSDAGKPRPTHTQTSTTLAAGAGAQSSSGS